MSDKFPSPPSGAQPDERPASERRSNLALRALIDEMMASIRGAAQGYLWTSEERSQYERELAQIMARVRTQAVGAEETVTVDASGN